MAKVSIIVPVYNVEKYLERCLDSLIGQSYQDIEIICVNDCSPDESQKIIDQYAERYPDKVKSVMNPENMGLGSTRDHGRQYADGEYIMFVDSDDYVEATWVESYISVMEKHGLDMVMGGFSLTSDQGIQAQPVPDSPFSIYMYASACTKAYRKQFLEEHHISFGGIRRSEDVYWTLSLALHNPKYKIIENAGYFYWQNTESITRKMDKGKQVGEDLRLLLDRLQKDLPLKSATQFQKDMIEYNFILYTVAWLYLYNHKCGISVMKERYQDYFEILKDYYPNYKKNKMTGFGKVKAGSPGVRLIVSTEIMMQKLGLGKLIYYIRACI